MYTTTVDGSTEITDARERISRACCAEQFACECIFTRLQMLAPFWHSSMRWKLCDDTASVRQTSTEHQPKCARWFHGIHDTIETLDWSICQKWGRYSTKHHHPPLILLKFHEHLLRRCLYLCAARLATIFWRAACRRSILFPRRVSRSGSYVRIINNVVDCSGLFAPALAHIHCNILADALCCHSTNTNTHHITSHHTPFVYLLTNIFFVVSLINLQVQHRQRLPPSTHNRIEKHIQLI